ncbi:MAG: NAD(P)-binding domain-containing protein [Sneathiellales bacterium]|nr:NAD(P)-binding domain-containing protein [Sneathiellales bacterium]
MGDLTGQIVGFIGLDGQNKQIAVRLRQAGATTYAFNRSTATRYEIARAGISLCQTPSEIMDKCSGQTLVLMLDEPGEINALLDEENSPLNDLPEGTTIINASPLEKELTAPLAKLAGAKGSAWIDARLTYDAHILDEGNFNLDVSATEADFNRSRPILEEFGQSVTRIDDLH